VAGFGNQETDRMAYSSLKFPLIFIIDKEGDVELRELQLQGQYKKNHYNGWEEINELADNWFPYPYFEQ
jgi:phosphatidate phosphatase PAH1